MNSSKTYPISDRLLEKARQYIPGGVNSPVRAFNGVGGQPLFFSRGEGPYLYSADGKRYIDYVCSWGAIILGHTHPEVIAAVEKTITNGFGFGTPIDIEVYFAEMLCNTLSGLDKVRAVNSGTEATMSAIRLARGFTKRNILVKFSGCYHGHADALLVSAGSGALTLGTPSSAGVPIEAITNTLVLPYNDIQAVEDCFARQGNHIAAVIVEPIAGNMNLVRGNKIFLETLRKYCHQYGTVLIFDEVMSGFRVGKHGAQGLYNIVPDLTCLGKVVGGGLGVAAFGGRQDIMNTLAPLGDVYQAGTLSGNPVALTAGIATLDIILNQENFYSELNTQATKLCNALNAAANNRVSFCAQAIGGMLGFYFRNDIPESLADIEACDINLFRQFFHAMLEGGVYLAPSAFEAGFLTAAHNDDVIEKTAHIAKDFFNSIL